MAEVLKVFISATSADLGTVRELVKQGLLTMHCLPVEQTNFPPDFREVAAMLEERIRGCEAVIHLVGLRYGAEPDPASLPAGAPRRSFTQMEADLARKLGKKVYVFLCPEDFPYDPAPPELEEIAALQREYRAEIVGKAALRTHVHDRHDVEKRVRELDFESQRLREENRRLKDAPSFDPNGIRVHLAQHLRRVAVERIARLNPVGDWKEIALLEKERDQQLADIDRFLEQIAGAYGKEEASDNFAIASQLLAERGLSEALLFMESKSESREAKIFQLNRAIAAGEQAVREKRELLRERLLTASLLEKDLQWDRAEAEYRAVVTDGGTWAEPRNKLAWLLFQRGMAVDPAGGNQKIREAAELCRGTLAANLRSADAHEWAATHRTFGCILTGLANRAEGTERKPLLRQAVAACRAALEVYTRPESPADWASTQNILGLALWTQGERAEGAEGRMLVEEAVAAYRAALEVNTREHLPASWALTQHNLGIALRNQGERAAGIEGARLLEEAAAAYRAALEVRTRRETPQDWAQTQNNLAVVLWSQGEREEGAAGQRRLTESVAAYRAALEVRTRDQSPQTWAQTQNNLGLALQNIGERTSRDEGSLLLGQAVAAYRCALEVFTREQLPQFWAGTQNNLATALSAQGARAETAERCRLLSEAVAACRATLEVFTLDRLPQAWAEVQHNLAHALWIQGERTDGPEGLSLLAEAVEAYRAALTVRTRVVLPFHWRLTNKSLAIALSSLAARAKPIEAARYQAEAEQIDAEMAEL